MQVYSLAKWWSVLKSPQNVSSENISELFHYTHNAKKEQIVGQNKVVFQLSKVNDFLDRNEGFQILEPYYHACGQLYENGIIDKIFYELLISIKQKDLMDSFSGAWVLCFSKNGNSAFMKRRYAAGDGWILGVIFGYLDNICIEFPEEYGAIALFEVEYSFNKLLRVMKSSLKKCYELYKQEPLNNDIAIKQNIVHWLSEYSLIYKSIDYKLEEEIRLVCKFNPGFSKWENAEYGIKFEASINGYSPIVRLVFDKKHLVYESQRIDACFDTKLNKSFLSSKEIQEVLKNR